MGLQYLRGYPIVITANSNNKTKDLVISVGNKNVNRVSSGFFIKKRIKSKERKVSINSLNKVVWNKAR
jgi:hypothetical protein